MRSVPVHMVKAIRAESEAILAERSMAESISVLTTIRGRQCVQAILAEHIGKLSRLEMEARKSRA